MNRARSACGSTIDDEWLLTPIPSELHRSTVSLFVRPSSRASSYTSLPTTTNDRPDVAPPPVPDDELIGYANCPPGLAKKDPPCVPPGQAKKRSGSDDWRIDVGRSLEGRDYVVVRSWQYGLEPAPRGSDYAVYDGMLVRIDEDTAEVLDLIRAVQAIAD